MPSLTFLLWTSWAMLLASSVYVAYKVYVKPKLLASPLALVSGLLFYLGLVWPMFLINPDDARYLPQDGLALFTFLAAIYHWSFILGYQLGDAPPSRRRPSLHRYLPAMLAVGGALCILGLGVKFYVIQYSGGFSYVYSGAHGSRMAFDEVSGQIYNIMLLYFPGLVICYAAAFSERSRRALAFAALLTVPGLADLWLNADRGDLIRIMLAIIVPYAIFASSTRRLRVTLTLALVGLFVWVFVAPIIRDATYISAEMTLGQALERHLDREITVTMEQKQSVYDEVVIGSGVIAGHLSDGEYDWGLTWLYPAISIVPRTFWPNKPYPWEWSGSKELAAPVLGLVPSRYSVITGVADTFARLSWMGPALWILLGYCASSLWRRAMSTLDVRDVGGVYVANMFLIFGVLMDWNTGTYMLLFFGLPLTLALVAVDIAAPWARPRSNKCDPSRPLSTSV